jgi:hypothetical protein
MPRDQVSNKHYYQNNATTRILTITIANDTTIITLNGFAPNGKRNKYNYHV